MSLTVSFSWISLTTRPVATAESGPCCTEHGWAVDPSSARPASELSIPLRHGMSPQKSPYHRRRCSYPAAGHRSASGEDLASTRWGISRPRTMSDSDITSGATDPLSWLARADPPTSQTLWPTSSDRLRTRTRSCTTTIGEAGNQKSRRAPLTPTSGLPTI